MWPEEKIHILYLLQGGSLGQSPVITQHGDGERTLDTVRWHSLLTKEETGSIQQTRVGQSQHQSSEQSTGIPNMNEGRTSSKQHEYLRKGSDPKAEREVRRILSLLLHSRDRCSPVPLCVRHSTLPRPVARETVTATGECQERYTGTIRQHLGGGRVIGRGGGEGWYKETCQSEGALGKVSSESVSQTAGEDLEDAVQGDKGRGRTELAGRD